MNFVEKTKQNKVKQSKKRNVKGKIAAYAEIV